MSLELVTKLSRSKKEHDAASFLVCYNRQFHVQSW